MKKNCLLTSIFVMMTFLVTGCGEAAGFQSDPSAENGTGSFTEKVREEDSDLVGADWRTTRDYGYITQNTPDGPKDLIYYVFAGDGEVMIAPDEYSYNPQFVELPGGIYDGINVRDTVLMKDYDGDGYDDLSLEDIIEGTKVSEVFLYDPENGVFEYSDMYSSSGAEDAGDFASLAGDWYVDGSLKSGHITIGEDGSVVSYSYEEDVNYEGTVRYEENKYEDGSIEEWFNIYDEGGEFVIGFSVPDDEDYYELYSGQDGAIHYVRSDHCTD